MNLVENEKIGISSSTLKNIIDNYIVKICYGTPDFTVSKAKKHIREFISTEDENRRKGAVAEFFYIYFYVRWIINRNVPLRT